MRTSATQFRLHGSRASEYLCWFLTDYHRTLKTCSIVVSARYGGLKLL